MTTDDSTSPGRSKGLMTWWWAALLICLTVRLLTLSLVPLTDHTEARYAEIARLMWASGDWISPHITPTEVFWAKPPLSTWGQALSMTVLGVSEFSARLPAVVWAALSLVAMAWMLKEVLAPAQRMFALIALALCPLFFLSAGAVMTDATLAATVLWVQAAWWHASRPGQSSPWPGRVLALAMGLALLTKGPAAAALALLPVLGHAAWCRHWGAVRRVLGDPWAWLVVLGLAVPWFAAAELRAPGFLQYFLLGEHVMRFIDPGWKGDRYGFAHAQPLGIIWLFALMAALPWVLMAVTAALRCGLREGWRATAARPRAQLGHDMAAYAWCMTLAPLLLFTPARNLISTYALTALPGIVLLCLTMLNGERRLWIGFSVGLSVVYALLYSTVLVGQGKSRSDQVILQAYKQACGSEVCSLRYAGKPPYSAHFYSGGTLYHPQPPRPGARRFLVAEKTQVTPAEQPLVCNREHCLLRESSASLP